MNHEKGMRAKALRGSTKPSRGAAAATATIEKSAATTTPSTHRGDASNAITSRSVKRGHEDRRLRK